MPDKKPEKVSSAEAKKEVKEETKEETKEKIKKWIEKDKAYFKEVYQENFNYYENLYQCKRDVDPDVPSWRSNFFFPIPLYTIQDELPRTLDGLIGQGDFYTIIPRTDNDAAKNAALIKEKLVRYHIDNTSSNFYGAWHDAVLSAKKKGIGWIKMSWMTEEGSNKYYDVADGKIKEVTDNLNGYDGPVWESPENIYFDSGANTWSDVRRVTEETYFCADDIREMKTLKSYDEGEINKFLEECVDNAEAQKDPTTRFLYQQVHTKNYIYGFLHEKYLIRSHICPYKRNRLQFYPVVKYPETGKIIGRGICSVLADITEEANDIQNLKVDNLILSVNKIFLKRSDAETPEMDIYPGAVLSLDDIDRDLKTVEWNGVNSDAFTEIELLMGLANRISGGAAGVTSPDGPQPINNKTATGVLVIRNESNWRMAFEIKHNKRMALRPMLRDLIDMIEQYQDVKQAKEILGEQFFKNYELEESAVDWNSEVNFILTGEEGLKGRQEDLDSIMTAMQILSQIPGAAEKINFEVIMDRIKKNLELPEDFFVEAVPGQEQGLTVESLTPQEREQITVMAAALKTTPEDIIARVNAGEDLQAMGTEAEAVMTKQKMGAM